MAVCWERKKERERVKEREREREANDVGSSLQLIKIL